MAQITRPESANLSSIELGSFRPLTNQNNMEGTPGLSFKPGVPSAALYFPEKCRSDILFTIFMLTNNSFPSPGGPPTEDNHPNQKIEPYPNKISFLDSLGTRIRVWKIIWDTRKKGEKAKWTDRAVALFTLGILLAAVIQSVIFSLQWHEMVTAGRQAEKAIKETNRLAKATEDLNRPWLGLAGRIVLGETAIKNRYSASYIIKNFGRTPAFKAISQLWFVSGDAKEWDETARVACELNMPFTKGTIPVGPNLKQPPPMGKALFPDQGLGDSIPWEAPEEKQWMAFVGCVSYKDALENYHWTRFCMESPNWNYTGKPFALDPKTQLHLCNVYNDTDDKKPEEDKAHQ